jgi:ankyrin repeat protein
MEIFNCLYKNDHAQLKAILLNNPGLDVNQTNDAGLTPLQTAVILGYVECVYVLVCDSRINVNRRDHSAIRAPILEAAAGGKLDIVEILLNVKDIDVNVVDSMGCSSLFLACVNGHAHVFERLCTDSRVNVNQSNQYGRTPLFIACSVSDIKSIDILLNRADIDINAMDLYGRTPFHESIRTHVSFLVIGKLMRRPDLDINRADLRGNTPLHTAATSGTYVYTLNWLLSDRRINIHLKNKLGFTATALAYDHSIIQCFNRRVARRRWAIIFCVAKLVILKRRAIESYYAYGGNGAIAAIDRCYGLIKI